jgi:hypothetical protein
MPDDTSDALLTDVLDIGGRPARLLGLAPAAGAGNG